MPRHIITGAPGAGKTTILKALRARGHPVVPEAATDVIARGRVDHRNGVEFIDAIVRLQRHRQVRTREAVFDRSPVCTLALARYLDLPTPPSLREELDRIAAERVYADRVFFVRLLGFIRNTRARRITLDQSIRFEAFHERAYRDLGYELIEVPAGPVDVRADIIEQHLR